MKKVVLVPTLLGVMGIGGFIAIVGGDLISSANSSEKLTVEQIEKKALQAVNGRITELEFEKEGTRSFYEVEVTTKDAEYDLKFDALTGELLKKDKDLLDLDDRRDGDFDDNPTSQNTIVNSVMVDDQDDKQVEQPVKTQSTTATQKTETQKSTNPTPTKVVVTYDDDLYDDDRYDDDLYDDDRYDDDDDDDDDRYDDDRFDDDDDDDDDN